MMDVDGFKKLIGSANTGLTRDETAKLIDTFKSPSNGNMIDLFRLQNALVDAEK